MEVKFVQCTPNPEENMAYVARVSNPNNQDNPSFEGLLKYCMVNFYPLLVLDHNL